MNRPLVPYLQALLAAALFGAGTPLSKIVLGAVEPIPLSSLLYLGSGVGLLLLGFFKQERGSREARLVRADWPWLAGAILAGGVAGPILLMFSLKATPAATASLLLNFEAVATALLAALLFHEAVGKRVWIALVLVTGAAVLLSIDPNSPWGFSLGALGILGACALWGLDNNCTRNIAAKDPLQIVTVKGLAAGSFSFFLALIVGQGLPSWYAALAAMALGFACYGFSIVLFILAMRQLGAARAGALLATAPFVGVLLSFLLFHEPPNWFFLAALPLMGLGIFLLTGERHTHHHHHEELLHEHRHRHDDPHHQHRHDNGEIPTSGWHSHPHLHIMVEHSHAHTPDLHHRHQHKK